MINCYYIFGLSIMEFVSKKIENCKIVDKEDKR